MRTLSKVLSDTATAFPDRDAIITQDHRFTYRDLNQQVDRLARGLMALGVEKGERVGLWMPNITQWVIAYFAIARIGGVVVPMNTRYKSHEVQYILANSGATTLFMVDSFVGIDYLAMMDHIRQELPNLKHVVVVGKTGADMHRFEEVVALGEAHPDNGGLAQREAACTPQECALILYTSGTTGSPKGAMLSHHNMVENAKQVTAVLHTTQEDVFQVGQRDRIEIGVHAQRPKRSNRLVLRTTELRKDVPAGKRRLHRALTANGAANAGIRLDEDCLVHASAADRLGLIKHTLLEVLGRKQAHLGERRHPSGGPVLPIFVCALIGELLEVLGTFRSKAIRISQRFLGVPANDDRLEPLRAHHCTEARPTGGA